MSDEEEDWETRRKWETCCLPTYLVGWLVIITAMMIIWMRKRTTFLNIFFRVFKCTHGYNIATKLFKCPSLICQLTGMKKKKKKLESRFTFYTRFVNVISCVAFAAWTAACDCVSAAYLFSLYQLQRVQCNYYTTTFLIYCYHFDCVTFHVIIHKKMYTTPRVNGGNNRVTVTLTIGLS